MNLGRNSLTVLVLLLGLYIRGLADHIFLKMRPFYLLTGGFYLSTRLNTLVFGIDSCLRFDALQFLCVPLHPDADEPDAFLLATLVSGWRYCLHFCLFCLSHRLHFCFVPVQNYLGCFVLPLAPSGFGLSYFFLMLFQRCGQFCYRLIHFRLIFFQLCNLSFQMGQMRGGRGQLRH